MCRVACISNMLKKNEAELLLLFKHLEKTNGGSGNGIGGWVNGKPYIVKGVKVTTDELAKIALETKWDNNRFLFHTRIASKGSVCDDNCHPFTYGDYITVHNGTTTTALKSFPMDMLEFHRLRGRDVTDSEAVSYLIGKYGPDVMSIPMADFDVDGVFLSLCKTGELFMFKSGTYRDLDMIQIRDIIDGKKHITTILASKFPVGIYDKLDLVWSIKHGMVTSLDDVLSGVVGTIPAERPYQYVRGYDYYKERADAEYDESDYKTGTLDKTSKVDKKTEAISTHTAISTTISGEIVITPELIINTDIAKLRKAIEQETIDEAKAQEIIEQYNAEKKLDAMYEGRSTHGKTYDDDDYSVV